MNMRMESCGQLSGIEAGAVAADGLAAAGGGNNGEQARDTCTAASGRSRGYKSLWTACMMRAGTAVAVFKASSI